MCCIAKASAYMLQLRLCRWMPPCRWRSWERSATCPPSRDYKKSCDRGTATALTAPGRPLPHSGTCWRTCPQVHRLCVCASYHHLQHSGPPTLVYVVYLYRWKYCIEPDQGHILCSLSLCCVPMCTGRCSQDGDEEADWKLCWGLENCQRASQGLWSVMVIHGHQNSRTMVSHGHSWPPELKDYGQSWSFMATRTQWLWPAMECQIAGEHLEENSD